ncbi:NAD(P)H-dependent flavin oxidoreductase [Streptomyces sp. NPDC059740]|uniref:NAD(P)H-dependent flavin oxidoreductase n=1 Tax=Streptomyces sp. NPDC059740 TaxID=3346926 RepID=UPI00365855F5
MPLALTDLCRHPIVQAPMAGGPSGPELAAAVGEAGGLGHLAAGYKSVDAMREEIRELRGRTTAAFGVNLFMPQPSAGGAADAVAAYRDRLAPEAARLGVEFGDPDGSTDDAYEAKVDALLQERVPVVSFTFGCPSRAVLDALAEAGTRTVVTVTSPAEARAAQWSGADAVCVQGFEAGGHRGTHTDDPAEDGTGSPLGLLSLVAQVRETVQLPIIAAGGLMRGAQIAAVLAAGADMGQLGTAFLLCPESGASATHQQALTNPAYTRTAMTRAFSGRPARGLANRFLTEHSDHAPAAYPAVHYLTSPLRKAAAKAGDADGLHLWAGQGFRQIRKLPAGQLVRTLAGELAAAREALAGRAPQPAAGLPGAPFSARDTAHRP